MTDETPRHPKANKNLEFVWLPEEPQDHVEVLNPATNKTHMMRVDAFYGLVDTAREHGLPEPKLVPGGLYFPMEIKD